ncbi:MAG: hypothetical protein AB1578_15805 [Thermodesulfobacteriota bacterium]
MDRWRSVGRIAACAAALFGSASAGAEEFRRGPVVIPLPPPPALERPLGFAPWGDVRAARWPEGFEAGLGAALEREGGVLLVGRTDPVGPGALNDSLGLQYAVRAAALLAAGTSRETWRFACASAGEDASGPPGVTAFAWAPPPAVARSPSPVLVLDPAPQLPRGAWLWSLWREGGQASLWSLAAGEGEQIWGPGPGSRQVFVPLPGRAEEAAVGAQYAGTGSAVVTVRPAPAREEAGLGLAVAEVEDWWARLRPTVPQGFSGVHVWAGGVPYPVALRAGGAADVRVALLPGENRAYLQALDARGRVAVGPAVAVPTVRGEPPVRLTVLVWEGDGVDLDLHAWAGPAHTHPQDPDAAFSARAAPGTRLLFDGDGAGRASALASWAQEEEELEVWCYSDLSGGGARAWVYRIDRPEDRLELRRTLHGPRRMSTNPLEARWPLPGSWAP